MAGSGPAASEFQLSAFPDPGDRFILGDVIGKGLTATVYEATDSEAGNMKVAVKVLQVDEDRLDDAREEYRVLRDLSEHPNLPDYYGTYVRRKDDGDELWFVMQYCSNGSVTDLARGLIHQNKKMNEDHIAYVLKQTIKALVHLHEHHVMHRDVRGSNILLTRDGEVKLVDYGLSRELDSTLGRRFSCLGSPAWLAPEVVSCSNAHRKDSEGYDNKCDVWSIGITAIELGDGAAPLQKMHPSRALFQIVRNPPPTLYRPANWTQLYNDFIAECLEKNSENRPCMPELMEHPFITALPEHDSHFATELKIVSESVSNLMRGKPLEDVMVRDGFLKKDQSDAVETMVVEDLAALEVVNEDTITRELEERYRRGFYHTFIGDVLLILNPNMEVPNMYGKQEKYQFKSRSDNQPHVYAVADSAYQDVFHNEEPQHIILAGETMSGKTTNFKHLLSQLLLIGKSGNGATDRIEKAVNLVHAMGNAATPFNHSSTRHVHHLEVTFTSTGKASGAIIWLYQLEKWRVTTECQKGNANFHIFYYFFDAMAASGSLGRYYLDSDTGYRYLRANNDTCSDKDPRKTPDANVAKYEKFRQYMADLEFEDDQRETVCKVLAAILILGEVTFKESDDGFAEVENSDVASNVAKLLGVDEKKMLWALGNYCVIQKGTAVRRRHTREEATQARDVMARALYARLVDWMVNTINHKLSYTRAIFGDKHLVSITDMFGFESHQQKNTLETLFVNTLNEQLTYHYGQRTFAWEMQDQEEDEIPIQPLQYYNNKPTVDELMLKPDGLLYLLDEASRSGHGPDFILESLRNEPRGPRIMAGDTTFTVVHYTGKVTYDVRAMAAKNRDFLPPEMIENMRLSSDSNIKVMFTNQLSKSGNLTAPSPPHGVKGGAKSEKGPGKKGRWGAALVAESGKCRHFNTESRGQYSQTRRMRTAAAAFRGACLEVLRALAFGPGCGGTHFVRCVRTDLAGQPRAFQQDLVRQQLRALAVQDTARARQKGYATRVPFEEFLRRYKFLAFDFDETVDMTKDNCRLLLIRLKMEGWVLGKTKVFLKYYHEEYLSRLYELQVKKIIKVQCMMRAFLAKKNMQTKMKRLKSQDSVSGKQEVTPKKAQERPRQNSSNQPEQDEAALVIQRNFRGYKVRKEYGPLISTGGKLDVETAHFIRHYCHKWKAKSMYQVLLLYRAKRYQDFVYFSQQAHMFNQSVVWSMHKNREVVQASALEPKPPRDFLEAAADQKPNVFKLPFRLQDPMLLGSAGSLFSKADPLSPDRRASLLEEEPWDAPFRSREKSAETTPTLWGNKKDQEVQTSLASLREAVREDERDERDERRPSVQYGSLRNGPAPPAISKAPSYATAYRETRPPGKFGASGSTESETKSAGWSPGWGPGGSPSVRNGAPRAPGAPAPSRRPYNPAVAELELRAQRQQAGAGAAGGSGGSDEPPFNFQAMLRKTNHGRASLKRRGSDEDRNSEANNGYSLSSPSFSSSQHASRLNAVSPTPSGSGSGRRSPRSPRPDSPTRRPRDLPPSTRRRTGSVISAELAPGIVVRGQVADL